MFQGNVKTTKYFGLSAPGRKLTKMIEDEVEVPGTCVGLHGGVGRSEYSDKGVEVSGVRPLYAGQETGKLKSEKDKRKLTLSLK